MVRLAYEQGLKLESFCYQSWGRGAQIMSGDIDLFPKKDVLETLILHTGASPEQAACTLLPGFLGELFGHVSRSGYTHWITHFAKRASPLTGMGLSYCPLCLRYDQIPFCRRYWRLAFVTMCVVHGVLLQDVCPHCDAPFSIHRWDKGRFYFESGHPITHCPVCRQDRTKNERIWLVQDHDVLAFQCKLEQATNLGWMMVQERPVRSLLFFDGLAMLAKIMLDRRRADRLRKELLKLGFVSSLSALSTKKMRVEYLDVARRFEVMQVLAWFLRDWPNRVIEVCRQANFSSSYLFDQAHVTVDQVPFWLWEPAYLHLSRLCYAPCDAEIDAAVSYLRKHQGEFKRIDLARLLGVSGLNRVTLSRFFHEFM